MKRIISSAIGGTLGVLLGYGLSPTHPEGSFGIFVGIWTMVLMRWIDERFNR